MYRVNPVNVVSTTHSFQSQYINKQTMKEKSIQIHFQSQRPHTIKKDNNINMDSTVAGSMNARCKLSLSQMVNVLVKDHHSLDLMLR